MSHSQWGIYDSTRLLECPFWSTCSALHAMARAWKPYFDLLVKNRFGSNNNFAPISMISKTNFFSKFDLNMITCQYQLLLHLQIHRKANCIPDLIVGKWIKSRSSSRDATYSWIKNGTLVQSSIFSFRREQNCKF